MDFVQAQDINEDVNVPCVRYSDFWDGHPAILNSSKLNPISKAGFQFLLLILGLAVERGRD